MKWNKSENLIVYLSTSFHPRFKAFDQHWFEYLCWAKQRNLTGWYPAYVSDVVTCGSTVSSVQAGATCTVWLGNQCLLSSCQPGKIKPTARNKFLPSTHRHTYLPETRPTMTDQCYEKMRKRKQPLVHLGQQECVKTYCWARPDLAVRGSALPQWNDHNQNTD